jgi:hypothetical protein
VVLIALGVVFLLQSLGFLRLNDMVRFWPVSLIAMGIYLLYRRVAEGGEDDAPSRRGGGFSGRQRPEDSLRPSTPGEESRSQPGVSSRSEEGGA